MATVTGTQQSTPIDNDFSADGLSTTNALNFAREIWPIGLRYW